MNGLRIGSLCSGAGGLDMAVERVFGGEVVWFCEQDKAASTVLAHRWPTTPNYGDLIATDWTQVEPVDIVCAGWPCQPFSLAGKRKGADDERAIWPHIANAIRLLRPRIVVLENVSAVLRAEFHRVANSFSALGYDLRWTCLRASDIGAPHRRERLFVVAVASGAIIWQPTGSASTEEAGTVAGDGLGDHRGERAAENGWAATNTAGDGRHARRPEPARIEERSDAAISGDGTVELLPTPAVADSQGTRAARGGNRSDELLLNGIAREHTGDWGKYAPAIRRWESLTRQPAPAPTVITARTGNKRLNPAFSEWMMGLPAGHVTQVPGISRNDALRIIGNGVVPQQATAALRWLLSVCEVAA